MAKLNNSQRNIFQEEDSSHTCSKKKKTLDKSTLIQIFKGNRVGGRRDARTPPPPSITTTTGSLRAAMLGPSSPNFQTRPSAVLSAVARIYGEGSTDRQKEKKRGEEEKDGSRKRGRVSRQRIISMTSKGVVISRPFLPFLSARVFLHAGTGLRVAAASHPCVIVLIQPYPSSNHLLLGFSTPPRISFRPSGRRTKALLCHPTTTPVDPPKARLPQANEACERRV